MAAATQGDGRHLRQVLLLLQRIKRALFEHLVTKLGESEASRILAAARNGVEYFSRRRPIQRMDRRTAPGLEGDPREGRKWQKVLNEGRTPINRLVALGYILYLVRSNLVHGSKMDAGDDQEIIEAAVRPMEELVASAISFTEAGLMGG